MFAMNLDEAKAITVEFGMIPNRPNIRRVVRAQDLVYRGHVRLQANFGDEQIYIALSQNTEGEAYTVRRNGKVQCTCPDHSRTGELCKHGLAVLLQEEKQRDEAMVSEWEAHESNRFACDGYELY